MRRVTAAIVTVVALVGGGAAVVTAPDDATVSSPIALSGGVGDRITGRAFASTVTGLTFGDRLKLTNGTTVDTPGIWLRVRARVTPRLALVDLDHSVIRTGSATYAAYATTDDLSLGLQEAGITVDGDLLFELPRSVADLPDADLVLDRGTLVPDQITVVHIHPRAIARVAVARVTPYATVTTEAW